MWVGALAVLTTVACSDEQIVQPLLPPEPPANPEIVAAGWTFDVLGDEGKILVTPPSRGYDPALLADYFGVRPGAPDLSLLAGDVVEILADNATLAFSPVGAFAPGQRRVTFDVAVRNKLSGVNLITPTFPAPPASVTGVLLFPFETTLINVANQNVQGGQGDGTYVIIETPNEGLVAPSITWDGAPHNFFNDNVACGPTDNDCYRYEAFPDVVGGATSPYQTVGFDAEATVQQFRFRGILAADLEDATPNVLPTVAFVGSPYSGTVPNAVTVTANATDLDLGGGVSQVLFDLDNNAVFETTVSASGTTFSAQASFTCSTSGSFTIGARAVDNRGGTSDTTGQVECAFPPANASADLSGPTSVVQGSNFDIVLTVTNTGIAPVTNISVSVALDADATLVSGGGLTTVAGGLSGTIASLAGGASQSYTITQTAETSAQSPNSSSVTIASADDTNAADDTDALSIAVTAAANVVGQWVSSTGSPITSATAGSTVFLQVCTTFGNVSAFQSNLSGYPGTLASANVADFNSVTAGVGVCANAGGTDILDQYTGNPASGGASFNVVNVTIAAAPGTGPQGTAQYQFVAVPAGTISPALIVSVLDDFSFLGVPPVVSIPSLTVN
jgi:hypothetical protein